MNIPRILITPGEPAGIGPDVTIKIAQASWPAELIVVGDPDLLLARAKLLNLPLTLKTFQEEATLHEPQTLKIIPIHLVQPCEAGILNPSNASYVISCLTRAIEFCLENKSVALVTGPVHKEILNKGGFDFHGHTEFLANKTGASEVVMLFVVDQLKVALVTTHLPLAAVSKNITQEKIISTIHLLHHELQKLFSIKNPRIVVCGLNPHAGENGLLGKEEIDVIIPALEKLRSEQIKVLGPIPADTAFTPKYLEQADVILTMYHDQGLPIIKHLGFDRAVNMTLGLPFIRTSVDHGTALDIVGTPLVNAGSMHSAIQLAIDRVASS